MSKRTDEAGAEGEVDAPEATEIAGASPAAHGVIYLSLATAAAIFWGYALHVVGARWLTTEDYGRFVLVLSIITWVESFQGAALSGIGKIVSEDHRRLAAALKLAKRWFLPSGVVGGGLLLAASPLIATGLGDRALTGLLVLAAVEIPLTAVFRMTVRFSGVIRRYAMRSVIYSVYAVGRSAFGCALIVLGLGAMGGIAGQVAATALAAGIGLYLLLGASRGLPEVDYPQMLPRSLSWAGYTMSFSVGISTLLAMDIWCVKGLMPDPVHAGFYGAAFALARTPKFFLQAVIGAVFPRVSHALAQGHDALAASVAKDAFRVLIIMLVPLCVLVGESATAIITWLFSERYAAAGGPLAVLMVAISVYACFQLMLALLAAADRPGLRMVFALGLVPVGLALNFLLIPRYGISGAAAATLITMTIGVISLAPFICRLTGAALPFVTFLRCGISGGLVYPAARAWSVEGWMLVPRLSLLGLAYLIILLFLGEVGRREMRSVAGALPGPAGTFIIALLKNRSPRE
ncbi:MAG: polysaccharide biosynthesis C-terminal domain-containing protein [Desulfatiglandaceae bacterium]